MSLWPVAKQRISVDKVDLFLVFSFEYISNGSEKNIVE